MAKFGTLFCVHIIIIKTTTAGSICVRDLSSLWLGNLLVGVSASCPPTKLSLHKTSFLKRYFDILYSPYSGSKRRRGI